MGDGDIVRFKVLGRRLWVPNDIYNAIERHASQRGQTVDQWVEEATRKEMARLGKEN